MEAFWEDSLPELTWQDKFRAKSSLNYINNLRFSRIQAQHDLLIVFGRIVLGLFCQLHFMYTAVYEKKKNNNNKNKIIHILHIAAYIFWAVADVAVSSVDTTRGRLLLLTV